MSYPLVCTLVSHASLGLSHHLTKWLAHSRYSINIFRFLKIELLLSWALNFKLKLIFLLLLRRMKNFSFSTKESQHTKKTVFPLNVSILTIWLLTLIECLLGARCYVGFECIVLLFTITREVEVSVSFHHLWYRKGDSHTQHHAAKECKKQDLNHLRVQSPRIF